MGQNLQQSRLEMSLEGAVWFGAEHKIYRQQGTQQPPEKGERLLPAEAESLPVGEGLEVQACRWA